MGFFLCRLTNLFDESTTIVLDSLKPVAGELQELLKVVKRTICFNKFPNWVLVVLFF
jgi:hypothetical protein